MNHYDSLAELSCATLALKKFGRYRVLVIVKYYKISGESAFFEKCLYGMQRCGAGALLVRLRFFRILPAPALTLIPLGLKNFNKSRAGNLLIHSFAHFAQIK